MSYSDPFFHISPLEPPSGESGSCSQADWAEWQRLHSFVPFFSKLPPHLWEEFDTLGRHGHRLRDNVKLQPQDRAELQAYTELTKTLLWVNDRDVWGPSILPLVKHGQKGNGVFPKLETLLWDEPRPPIFPLVAHLPGPGRALRALYLTAPNRHALAEAISCLLPCSEGLMRLHLATRDKRTDTDNDVRTLDAVVGQLLRFVPFFSALSIDLDLLTPALAEAIEDLDDMSLVRINIHGGDPDVTQLALVPANANALQLSASTLDLTSFEAILKCFAPLVALRLELHQQVAASTVDRLLKALSARSRQTLTDLHFIVRAPEAASQGPRGLWGLMLASPNLEALKSLPGLHTLHFEAPHLVLTTGFLEQLADALPRVQTLRMFYPHRTPGCKPMPLPALHLFVNRCPELTELVLQVNASDTTVVQVPSSKNVLRSKSNLVTLGVADSLVGTDAMKVVVALKRMFTRLKNLQHTSSEEAAAATWDKVAENLAH